MHAKGPRFESHLRQKFSSSRLNKRQNGLLFSKDHNFSYIAKIAKIFCNFSLGISPKPLIINWSQSIFFSEVHYCTPPCKNMNLLYLTQYVSLIVRPLNWFVHIWLNRAPLLNCPLSKGNLAPYLKFERPTDSTKINSPVRA